MNEEMMSLDEVMTILRSGSSTQSVEIPSKTWNLRSKIKRGKFWRKVGMMREVQYRAQRPSNQ
jgi:hypothetical protein